MTIKKTYLTYVFFFYTLSATSFIKHRAPEKVLLAKVFWEEEEQTQQNFKAPIGGLFKEKFVLTSAPQL